MASKRSVNNRGKGRKSSAMEVDITSLLDILVIILVFLLKSYNSSGVTINIPKELILPSSESTSLNTFGIIVQVTPTSITVEDKNVLDTADMPPNSYDHGGRRIIPLYNELVSVKETIKEIEKSSPNAKKFSGLINLIMDKTLKYHYIKKILYTCAEAGYKEYKFVVQSQHQ